MAGKRKIFTVSCAICGNVIQRTKRPGQTEFVCSYECRGKLRQKLDNKSCTKNCEVCGEPITRCAKHFARVKHVYCSHKCTGLGRQKLGSVELTCQHCGKKYTRLKHAAIRGKHNYCSVKCRNASSSASNYVEVVFEKMVKPLGLKVLRNNRETIGLELDFYFPDLKFAVEINGASHYKPIYGQDKLKKTRKNDRKKRRLCKENGIRLRTVKPGDCKEDTLLKRYRPIIAEIKKLLCGDRPKKSEIDIFAQDE
jgi:hypothetical protein